MNKSVNAESVEHFDISGIARDAASEPDYPSILEALLFVWAEPISAERLARALELTPRQVRAHLQALEDRYASGGGGLHLIEAGGQYQLGTRTVHYPYIERLCTTSKNRGLSNSALEVLAIIAYRQPVTRADIEQIRGVHSDGALQTLINRELVEITGRLERIGRPQTYGTTQAFLKAFGFKSLEDLPGGEDADMLKAGVLFDSPLETDDEQDA